MSRFALLAVALAVPALAAQSAAQRVDLPALLAGGKLTVFNRTASKVDGAKPGVRLSAAAGNGIAWVEGVTFNEGTIEIEARGKDVLQQSFLGVAFHGKDDSTYEAVYLRPFNFRATDPLRHQHAVQYVTVPDYDWPRLRAEFPEEFENPVDASVSPTDWVPLKIVVAGQKVQIFVGTGTAPALEVRKLGTLTGGKIGLWVGNGSDGDFANLRVTPAR
jgi:hypothetical protein